MTLVAITSGASSNSSTGTATTTGSVACEFKSGLSKDSERVDDRHRWRHRLPAGQHGPVQASIGLEK
jgi:hypothetical protein